MKLGENKVFFLFFLNSENVELTELVRKNKLIHVTFLLENSNNGTTYGTVSKFLFSPKSFIVILGCIVQT